MKAKRALRLVALCLCICLCLPFAACSKYRLEMSNEAQSRTVLSFDGYDVPFEVLYFFYHSSESTSHADKLADAMRDTAELYAIFSVLRDRGIDPFGEEMNARTDEAVREMIDSFDTRREYIDSLALRHMTDNTCRILLRSYLCEARLQESDMKDALKEEIPAFCAQDDVVRAMGLVVYFSNSTLRPWAEGRAEELLGMLATAPNTDAAFEEIAGSEASFEGHNYMTHDQLRALLGEDSAFTPTLGYISDAIFDNTSFLILRIAEKDLSYVEENPDKILPAYIDYLITKATVTDLTLAFTVSEADFT